MKLWNHFSSIGEVIDTPIETLNEHVEDEGNNVTDLLNMKKMLELQYGRVSVVRDSIIKGISEEFIEKEEGNKSIQQLNIALQNIEDRVSLFNELIKDKDIQFLRD